MSVAEEPRRVEVRSAPDATVAAVASVEFLHVLAELVDHVTSVYPGARVDLVSHVEPFGGIMVDVAVDGRPYAAIPTAATAAAAAEVLARRSATVSAAPPAGRSSASGPVASVHCPAAAVTVEETWPTPAPSYPAAADPYRPRTNGNGSDHWSDRRGNGSSHPVTAPPPVHTPSAPSQVDELFGPIVDLPLRADGRSVRHPDLRGDRLGLVPRGPPEPAEAQQGDGAGGRAVGLGDPEDQEWRAAAARRRPTRAGTAHGRRPAAPAPRRPAGAAAPRSQGWALDSGPGERVPDRVRERLTTYQRGLRQGRHRAPTQDGSDPDDW